MELRPYQQEAVSAVFHEWESVNSTLVVAATGTGKTILFSTIAKRLVDENKKVLILAHRGDLLEQAQDKLYKSVGLESSLEKAENHATLDANVVVASVQTLSRENRLLQYPKNHFGAIIIDEAHHAVNDTYTRILDYFEDVKLLGVTATPSRSDLRSISDIFETTAFCYDVDSAIQDGWLSNIAVQRCNLEIDISDVDCVAGDYQAGALETALEPYLEQIADRMVNNASDRKTLVFTPTIALGEHFADMLCEKGLNAACISSKNTPDEREWVKAALANGEYKAVTNSMLWCEGFDEPSIDCIVNLRATKSVGLYRQIMGRGLRLYPGKENLLVLDFLWHSSRKGYDILSPIDLFVDNADIPFAEELLKDERVYEIGELAGLALDARIAKMDAAASLAKRLREAQIRHFGSREFKELRKNDDVIYIYDDDTDDLDTISIKNDPVLKFYFGSHRWDWSPSNYWQLDAITDKQRELLQNIGVNLRNVQFKGQASEIINTYLKRKDDGLCSYKQSNVLRKRGFVDTEMWSFASASEMMTRIADNHWRIPYGIVPARYKPDDFLKSVRIYQKYAKKRYGLESA